MSNLPACARMLFCNAGHNSPLLLRSNNETERLGSGGLPLGILRDAAYQQKTCRLESGDLLVLYSDGVTEAFAPGTDEEFGEQLLLAAVRAHRNRPAAALIEAISPTCLPSSKARLRPTTRPSSSSAAIRSSTKSIGRPSWRELSRQYALIRAKYLQPIAMTKDKEATGKPTRHVASQIRSALPEAALHRRLWRFILGRFLE